MSTLPLISGSFTGAFAAIRRFAAIYLVTRRSATTYVSGFAVAPTTTVLSILAAIQPISTYEIQRAPEGYYNRGAVNIWTPTQLFTVTEDNEPDVIYFNSDHWQIDKVEVWPTRSGSNVYKATAILVAS